MQKFIMFVLQLYLAVILTLFIADQAMAYRRIAQFKQMEDCCVSAADQYASFSAVHKAAATLDGLAQLDDLSRLDRYRAVSAWEQSLMSPAKDHFPGEWGRPGADAAERIASFLARRKITPLTVEALARKFREAGPDIDPDLDDDESRATKYLLNNLTYLGAVTGVARTELREILSKQAGGERELDNFVASRASSQPIGYRAACSAFKNVETASSLGRTETQQDDDPGFLGCIRNALSPAG